LPVAGSKRYGPKFGDRYVASFEAQVITLPVGRTAACMAINGQGWTADHAPTVDALVD
jgi:hypothetical protein